MTTQFSSLSHHVLLRVELVLLERLHELGREAESAKAEGTLGAAANIVNKGDCPLVHLLLVEVLVLDHVHVDPVTHVGAGVPANVVRIDVDLTNHADHLSLVNTICLGAGRRGSRVGSGIIGVRLDGGLDNGERERVCNFEEALVVQADEGTGRDRREGLGAVLDDFHHHLEYPA
jgi:hypothetical protein